MKKSDCIFATVVVIISIIGLFLYLRFGKENAGLVTVTVEGELFGTYSLQKDQEIHIHDTNFLIIKDGKADVVEADCPDQICVEQKSISKNKESIVCLPNKVIIEVVGGEDKEFDAVIN